MSRVVCRRCVSCGIVRPKAELVRVSRDRGGHVGLGDEGRGAYVCRSAECVAEAIRRKRLASPLRVGVGSVDWEALERRLFESLEDR